MSNSPQGSAEIQKTKEYLNPQQVKETHEAYKESKEMGVWDKTKRFAVDTWNSVLKGAEEDYKNKDYGKLAVKGVLGLGAAWLTKEVIQTTWEGVKGVWNWTEEKLGGVQKETQSSLLKSALKLILPAGALGGLIGVVGKSDLSITKMLSLASNPSELAKYVLDEAKKGGIELKGELGKWVKKKVKNIASLGDESVKKSLNVYEKDPRLESLWNIGVTRLQGIIGLTGVNASFLNGMKAEVPKMLSDAGVTPDMLEEINKGKTPSGLPQWLGPVVALGVPTIMGVIMARYLLSPGRLLKLGGTAIKLAPVAAALFLFTRSANASEIKFPRDIGVSEEIAAAYESMGIGERAQGYLDIVKDSLVMEKIQSLLRYLKEKIDEYEIDLPFIEDVRNLNPFTLVALISKEGFESDAAKTALTDFSIGAASFGLAGLIGKKIGLGKTILATTIGLTVYFLYKDGEKNATEGKKKTPEEFFDKDSFSYVIYNAVEHAVEYKNMLVDNIIDRLNSNEKTKTIVTELRRLESQEISALSPEWFNKLTELLEKSNISMIFMQGGIGMVGSGIEMIYKTTVDFYKAGIEMAAGALFQNSSYVQQGALDFTSMSVPFLAIGKIIDPEDAVQFALATGGGAVALGTTAGYQVLKNTVPTTVSLIRGKYKVMSKVKNTGKIVSQTVQRVNRISHRVALMSVAGKGEYLMRMKYVKGIGWLGVAAGSAEGAYEFGQGYLRDDEVGDAKMGKGGTKLAQNIGEGVLWLTRGGRSAAAALAGTGIGLPAGAVLIGATTAIEAVGSGIISAFESEEEMEKNVKDWLSEGRSSLIHHLILTNDSLTFGDATNVSRDNTDILAQKSNTRKNIIEALMIDEADAMNEKGIPYRLDYIEKHTSNFNIKDQSQLRQLLYNSYLYAMALILPKPISDKNNLQEYKLGSVDLMNSKVMSNPNKDTMDEVVSEYKKNQNDNLKKAISLKVFNTLEKLSETELVYYTNQLDIYCITHKKRESNKNIFEVQKYLSEYYSVNGVYYTPEILDFKDKQKEKGNEKALMLFSQKVLSGNIEGKTLSYHIDNNPLAFALYELAAGFGYMGQGKMEDLKKFFDEDHAYARAIYWDGDNWVVQEAGMESDDEIGSSDIYKFVFGEDNPKDIVNKMIEKIEGDKGNILEYKHDKFLDLGVSGTYDSREEQEQWIANSLKTGLKKYDNFSK